jgi:dTDP-glucose pyrophosphorylase
MKNIFINEYSTIYNAMQKLQLNAEKCLIVVNKKKKLLGTITDGDLRRAILNKFSLNSKIKEIYKKDCVFFYKNNFNLIKLKKKVDLNNIPLVPLVGKNKVVLDYFSTVEKKNNKKDLQPNIETIIMAGGVGKRMLPFTYVLPKPLIPMPLTNKTLIETIIDRFLANNIKNFIISINFKSKIIKSFFKDLNHTYNIKFLEEKLFSGTAGSLALLKNKTEKDYFVINCDTIIDYNFHKIYNFHKKNKNLITIVASTKKFLFPFGIIDLNSEGNLKKMIEKPSVHHLVNTGFYVVNNKAFNYIPKNKKFDFNELIEKVRVRKEKIGIYPITERSWKDVGQWNEYVKNYKNNDK